jgi:Bacterial dnaA protein helix-turn-helix/TIR domain
VSEPVLGVSQMQDPDTTPQPASGVSQVAEMPSGRAFISYVREDAYHADRLRRILEAAGVSVWLDTSDHDLWPGQDWRLEIRRAITDSALVFIACFSSRSAARIRRYPNEGLLLAIEQLRTRRPDVPWLIPVRFDDCLMPDLDLGGGRTLASIQRADLFGEHREVGITRLVTTVQWLLREIAIKDLIPEAQRPQVTTAMILGETAAYFGLSIEELCGWARSAVLVKARFIAMYLCRELTDLSLPKIGQQLGGRDHTTVITADRQICSLMAARRSIYMQVTELTNRIRQRADLEHQTTG